MYRALRRALASFMLFNSNKSGGTWMAIGPRLALSFSADDEIAHGEGLFARFTAVADEGFSDEQLWLKTVVGGNMRQRGAELPKATLARLIAVNGEIAQLIVCFDPVAIIQTHFAGSNLRHSLMVEPDASRSSTYQCRRGRLVDANATRLAAAAFV